MHCYLALKKAGRVDHNYLVMGPWRHSQVNAEGCMLEPLHWDGDTTAQFRRDVLWPFFD
jgi:predicted acyl esterase